MLSLARRAFNGLGADQCHETIRRPAISSLNERPVAVGLSFVKHIHSSSTDQSNIIGKPRPRFELFDQDDDSTSLHGKDHGDGYRPSCSSNEQCWFLKSCSLCSRPLNPDIDDVYMYRGDQGFCSRECRSWQIILDELDFEELEAAAAAAAAALNAAHFHHKIAVPFV